MQDGTLLHTAARVGNPKIVEALLTAMDMNDARHYIEKMMAFALRTDKVSDGFRSARKRS
jgi:hypothetical protein